MKRSAFVIVIIGLILFWGIYSQILLLKNTSLKTVKYLDDISDKINSPSYTQKTFKDYEKDWKKAKNSLSLIISHDELDEIEKHNQRLCFFLTEEKKADSLAEIGELKSIHEELYEKFKISFKNIL